MYKYYLDGVLLEDEPQGWSEFVTNINRDNVIKGLFVTQDVTLVFTGDGYTILKDKFDINFCDQTEITIEVLNINTGTYELFYEGIIFISSCSINADTCILETTVEDNSFFAKIYNNQNIKTFVEVGTSKNLVSYTGATSDTFQTIRVCDLFVNAQDRVGVTPYEAFRSIIAFMTDDTVDFESTLLEPGGEWNSDEQRLFITSGLKLGSTDPLVYGVGEVLIPEFSFKELFTEIDKNLNIGLMINTTGARPKVIIEKNEYFYNQEITFNAENATGIKVSIDSDKLFGTIHFGSSTTVAGTSCPAPEFPEDQTFLSFKDEQFYVLGTCNIDTELDLLRNWIVSSNVIQSVTPPLTETGYDNDLFLVVCEEIAGINYTKMGNPFNIIAPFPRFYNEALFNSNVALRYIGSVPNTINQALANITDECWIGRVGLSDYRKIKNTYTTTIGPLDFNNKTTPPFFDTNNRYTLATDRYTCGATSGGLYRFEAGVDINIVGYNGTPNSSSVYHIAKFQFVVSQFDSFGVLKGTYNYWPQYIYSNEAYGTGPLYGHHNLVTQTQLIVLEAADYIVTSLVMTVESVNTPQYGEFLLYVESGYFKTVFTSKGGGTFQNYDPAKYPVYKYEFSYPVSCEDFETIKNNQNKSIRLTSANLPEIVGSIDQLKYNHKTGMGEFTLIKALNP